MAQSAETAEIFRAQISSRMRIVRKTSDATQNEAAEICGVSPRSYKDYELGRRSMPVEVMVKFCEAFRISSDEMLFGKRPASGGAAASSDLVAEIAHAMLSVFGAGGSDEERERQVRMACYAWQGAKAKGRDFTEELREVSALTL